MEREQLYKFFEGTASVEEGMNIKSWVENSAENEQAFYEERKMFNALVLHSNLSPDSTLAAKEEKKSTFSKPKTLCRSILKVEWLKMVGVMLLTLSISYFYQQYKQSLYPQSMNIVSVPAGQRANVTLPDGSNVWLNARTTIQYANSFNDNERVVILKGEAYFDITKDEKRPFVVQTEKYNVEVLGTQFNVSAYPGHEEFETALMHGSVKINRPADPNQSIRLVPDQKAVLKDGKLEVTKLDNYDAYRWKEGLICFKDEAFLDIMKCFEKYYGVEIIINNKEALKYYYTGKFRQADGIDYALNILQKDINIKYTKTNDGSIIYIN
ncbi:MULTISPECIES: FecR family protein [Bacteroides]|uniref:FecR family protein n=1 Tax=Bacteroides TaxID=816 RepID=UPI0004BB7A3A|nr:FecR family protein [Bacteroides neonati]